jgi:hypothetical protein
VTPARLLPLLAAALCLAGAALAVRRAGAAWVAAAGTPEALRSALAWTPDDASLHRRLGAATGSRAALEAALRLNPRDAPAWIELGLLDEAASRPQDAEAKLLAAVRHSRRYLPHWTLASFYFRQGRAAAFWPQARATLAIAPVDPTPLFRLCVRLEPDGDRIRERVVEPGPRRALADWVTFLLAEGHTSGLRGAALALARRSSAPDDRERVLAACDRLLAAGRWEEAQEVWTARNGGSEPLSGHGFDWRVLRVRGFTALSGEGGLVELTLDGTQPAEPTDLLRRPVILPCGTKWRLTAEPAGADTDLYWRLTTRDGREVAASARLLPWEVEECGPAWLSLAARRQPGRVRWSGTLVLRRVEWQPR